MDNKMLSMSHVPKIAFFLVLVIGGIATAQQSPTKHLKIDPKKSEVSFLINAKYANWAAEKAANITGQNIGGSKNDEGYAVKGIFSDFSGDINFVPGNISDSKIQIEVLTASVHTDKDDRDKHLRSEDFFDSTSSPKATFRSLNIQQVNQTQFLLKGKLIIRGTPQNIVFNLTGPKEYRDDQNREHFIFTATAKINRTDFGIGTTGVVTGLLQKAVLIDDALDLNITIDAYEDGAK